MQHSNMCNNVDHRQNVIEMYMVTGPFNEPVLFCWLASVVVCRGRLS